MWRLRLLLVRTHGNYFTAYRAWRPTRGIGTGGSLLIVFALRAEKAMPVRVLIVDDDELSREVLELLLEADGYEVETAASADEALACLRAMQTAPDVVLTDMQMPGTTGNELAGRIRKLCGMGATLLAMSGSAPLEGVAREFDGFLLKPFSMEALGAAIRGGSAARADVAGGGVAALDEEIYGKLAALMGVGRMGELYTLCIDDVERRVIEMRRTALQGEDAAFRREAHAIKGSCGMVGAKEMQTLATSMEERGLCDDHVASLDELILAGERLRRILIARKTLDDAAREVSGEDAG
ncbi:response regulator [Granulicella sp. L60]|uniref:response regulator n=1 Tax=Granulicella sp. L60 TaxID=1641866 RepID=UPI00131EBEB4|nr:response regulator [Granulicella sp. L60]